jgi:hypothetical protein
MKFNVFWPRCSTPHSRRKKMNFRNLCYRFLIEKVFVHVGNNVFVKLLEFQWERIELLSLLICFYSSFCTCNVSDFNNYYLVITEKLLHQEYRFHKLPVLKTF